SESSLWASVDHHAARLNGQTAISHFHFSVASMKARDKVTTDFMQGLPYIGDEEHRLFRFGNATVRRRGGRLEPHQPHGDEHWRHLPRGPLRIQDLLRASGS